MSMQAVWAFDGLNIALRADDIVSLFLCEL